MTGNQSFAILLKKLKSVATGVKGVAVDPSNPSKLLFTLNDNSTISITIPNPVTTVAICNKLSVDTDGYLCYDNKRICDLTDDEITLLKKFSENANGELEFDGERVSLSQYFDTLADMIAYVPTTDSAMAVCAETKKLYIYNVSNTVDVNTKKWRIVEGAASSDFTDNFKITEIKADPLDPTSATIGYQIFTKGINEVTGDTELTNEIMTARNIEEDIIDFEALIL